MSLPHSVEPLVHQLLDGFRDALGDNFTGAYLCGSLALDGFDPRTSDVDVLVATERVVSDNECASLRALHEQIPVEGNDFGLPYEVYYIDRATLRRYAPGQYHVKVGPDEPLHRGEHRPNWVIERAIVREHGIVLAGPDPSLLIDEVSADDIRRAGAAELRRRHECWTDGTWPMTLMARRLYQSFEVETTCRALHAIASGKPTLKRESVEWALAVLPSCWHPLIQWSQQHRKDATSERSRQPEVMAFLDWAVSTEPVPER